MAASGGFLGKDVGFVHVGVTNELKRGTDFDTYTIRGINRAFFHTRLVRHTQSQSHREGEGPQFAGLSRKGTFGTGKRRMHVAKYAKQRDT